MEHIIKGQCNCGAIRFKLTGQPRFSAYCHCQDCRRTTGQPVAAFVGFKRKQVSWESGEVKKYESSPGTFRGFCDKCGTPLTFESNKEKWIDEIHFFTCNLHNPEAFPPTGHAFWREKIQWLSLQDKLER